MEENNKSYDSKNYAREIAALKSKISYLKSKRTKICQMCGKEFAPNNLKEKYCSDDCRQKAIKETKRKNYLKYRQKPEFVEKNRQYAKEWRIRTGRVVPKLETVSVEEYKNLKDAYEGLKQSYDKFFNEYKETVKENLRLIQENHELRNKSFLQKLKDLF